MTSPGAMPLVRPTSHECLLSMLCSQVALAKATDQPSFLVVFLQLPDNRIDGGRIVL